MNFYATKVESSFNIAKEEMAKLTVAFKEAYKTRLESNDATQWTTFRHHANPNIIRNHVIVRSKGSRPHKSGREGFNGPSVVPPARPRVCQACNSFGHDRRNCPLHNSNSRSQGEAAPNSGTLGEGQRIGHVWTNPNIFMIDDSIQDSIQSDDFIY